MNNYKLNNQIKAAELRVIDENGENLGILSFSDALKLSFEKGLDLVEISPSAVPPVAKIISFDKFRYQKDKELKRGQKLTKAKETKKVRISARVALNDLQIKVSALEKFLNDGHKVEINLVLRGREKGNRDWGRKKLHEFLQMIKVSHQIVLPPKDIANGFIAQVAKKQVIENDLLPFIDHRSPISLAKRESSNFAKL